MNKGNIHTCINDLWYDDLPEQQRARENRYYNALEEPVRYRKKSSKKNPGRCDHKHVYVNAEILITNRKGIERHFVGKVCSICNRLHSKTAKDCIFLSLRKCSEPIPPGLKRYRYLSETDEVIEE